MGISLMFGPRQVRKRPLQKLKKLNWLIILILTGIAFIGFAMLYSVAGGDFSPWASRQMIRFAFALLLMIAIALTDLRIWMALAYPAYFGGLALLIAVELIGATGMGGQRWLDIGIMRIQPSEFMKLAVVLALARYFHGLSIHRAQRLQSLVVPLFLIAIPAALVVRQPDLGTALMVIVGGIAIIFLAGARMWLFVTGFIASLAAIPVVWNQLRDYQQDRVLTFLNPENDPLGAGYQIMQAKIALGSGGVFGKGFMQGTQSHLNFLPEMKTDFIFTVLTEEFGMVGGLVLILLYMILLGYAVLVSISCRSQFGRILASGLSFTLFLYVFINIAMVMGLLPVVGVPLPLVSYGGSAMLTMMVAYGLILSVALHRDITISRTNPFAWE